MNAKKGRRPTTSAAQRAAALAYIKENHGALTKEIIAFLGWDTESGSKRLMWMCKIGELRREPVSMKCGIGNRIVRTFRYWAIVEEIFGQDDVENILEAIEEGGEEQAPQEVLPPWHYRHNDPKRMAIKDQGGQGASGPRRNSAITQLD